MVSSSPIRFWDFSKPPFLLCKLPAFLLHVGVHHHPYKIILIVRNIMDDFSQVFKDDPFHNHVTDVVHGTFGSIVPVILAKKIVFIRRIIGPTMETEFTTTIRTIEQTGEHRHFPPSW